MEKIFDTEILNNVEQKINTNLDLLEIAKTFCDSNYEKATEIASLDSIIEIILANQKELTKDFDKFLISLV